MLATACAAEADAWLESALGAAEGGASARKRRRRSPAAETEAGAEGAVGRAEARVRHALALDCEWAAPWHRAPGRPERIGTVQLYHPEAGALVYSLAEAERRALARGGERADAVPARLAEALARRDVAIVGVAISGDASRCVRDMRLVGGAEALYDCGGSGGRGLQELVKHHLPRWAKAGAADKGKDAGVRTSDWNSWPLTDAQVTYAAMDAALSYSVFAEIEPLLSAIDAERLQSVEAFDAAGVEEEGSGPAGEENEPAAANKASANANFFIAMRNRSMAPPNKGSKGPPPRGDTKALAGISVLVTGVLDSMSRDEMKEYVEAHGGKLVKSVTKALTYLVNDHGEVSTRGRACGVNGCVAARDCAHARRWWCQR